MVRRYRKLAALARMGQTLPIMGNDAKVKRSIQVGPAGQRVAKNVAALREARHLTRQAVADRMNAVGRQLIATAIDKIERSSRRVDVDDLVALAVALDVSPNRLLLAPGADDSERIDITAEVSASEAEAWRWASGEQRLPRLPFEVLDKRSGAFADLADVERFRIESRPHDPPKRVTGAEIEPHLKELSDLARHLREVEKRTALPRSAILDHIAESPIEKVASYLDALSPDELAELAERAQRARAERGD